MYLRYCLVFWLESSFFLETAVKSPCRGKGKGRAWELSGLPWLLSFPASKPVPRIHRPGPGAHAGCVGPATHSPGRHEGGHLAGFIWGILGLFQRRVWVFAHYTKGLECALFIHFSYYPEYKDPVFQIMPREGRHPMACTWWSQPLNSHPVSKPWVPYQPHLQPHIRTS